VKKSDVVRLGREDGAETVRAHCDEWGEESLLDAGPTGWDTAAINASIHSLGPLEGAGPRTQELYYGAYAKGARAEWKRLAAEIRARLDVGEDPARGWLQGAA